MQKANWNDSDSLDKKIEFWRLDHKSSRRENSSKTESFPQSKSFPKADIEGCLEKEEDSDLQVSLWRASQVQEIWKSSAKEKQMLTHRIYYPGVQFMQYRYNLCNGPISTISTYTRTWGIAYVYVWRQRQPKVPSSEIPSSLLR